jgi:glucokinase
MEILCFESGGTKLVAALADAEARLLRRQITSRRADQQACDTIAELLAMGESLREGKRVQAVSFGFGGTVRRSDGQPVECYHEEGWKTVNVRKSLQTAFQAPVFIENDCNLAALAEAHACGYPLDETLLYVTVGTGIGGGLVKNGKLLQLSNLGEGEIGHLVVDPDGPSCPCGNRGCLETLCSGPGLANLANQILGEPLDAPTLMQAFRQQDVDATRVLSKAASYLAQAIAAATNIVAPNRVILGGGVMIDGASFLNLIEKRCRPLLFPPFRNAGIDFQLSQLQEDVVCQGAARFALQNLPRLEVDSDI